ncbi:CAP domain-containing protein [Sphingomonas sp. HITSZ_GF]|uniref:CAP domain-containing protein n=1 Tax=Sphingomonas sp. HITSZ_GF TaxID=3037247 RepID=UPI00240E5CBE|nr:CAP domain-containing protein [Sphingomonas sp. HITSZ_GF]MDG2535734.1 CAP domain-containing protein [Sphingomonas sp. HITSZ_GF]
MRSLIPVLLLGSAVAACSGGGGSSGGGGGTVVTPTPTPAPGSTPTPLPTTTPTPTPASTEPATGSDFTAGIAALYSTQADITACQAGVLKPEVGARVLATLNDIRAHHRLPAVTYASTEDAAVQQSALMMAANGQLSHTPPSTWNCYTAAGATAAGQSNIYLGMGGGLRYTQDADILIGWLTDTNNLVANNIGHRRWLLHPFLSTISYGRVAGRYQTSNRTDGASIKVINSSQNTAGPLPDYVAYPFEDYPARYFDTSALLSFGVIANKSSNFGANSAVNFSAATISVRVRGGAALTVSNISFDNDGYGLPNNLQWSVAGLAANTIYDVTISNVTVSGATRSYSYYFRLVP